MMKRLSRFLLGTLRGRLILGVAAVHAVMMALFIGDLTNRQRAMLLDRQIEAATALSEVLATSAAGWIAADDIAGLQELVEAQRRNPEVLFVMLVDRSGRVLAGTDTSRQGLYLLDLPGGTRQAVLSNSPSLVDVATPATIGGRHVGWARVGIGQKVAGEKLAGIIRSGITYALAAILIGSAIAWFMGRRITQRLYAVQETINAIRSGDRLARSSLAGGDEAAVLAMEFNGMVDALEERDAELRASEERYRSLIRKVRTAIVVHDGHGRILDSNPLAQELLGLSADQLLVKALIDPEWRFVREDGSVLPVAEYPASLVLSTRKPLRGYLVGVIRPDRDEAAWMLVNAEPEFGDQDEITGVIVSFVDITERKRAEKALHRLNRELRAISDCNQALMRAEDEPTLLSDICRIVCDGAGYRMVWAGYPENDEAKTIRAVAWAGVEEGYLEQAGITWADTERGRGPSGMAIRTGESACIQDFATDPKAAPWRELASQRGYRSSISMPLKDEDAATFGVLTIYSTELNAFTEDEVRLLEELAGDLAFGIVVMRSRLERKRAENDLTRMNERFSLATKAAHLGVWDWDLQKNELVWDDRMYELYGVKREDFSGAYEAWLNGVHPEDRDSSDDISKQARRGEREYDTEFRVVWPDGSIHHLKAYGQFVRDADGNPSRMTGINFDITDHKQAEEDLHRLNRELWAMSACNQTLMRAMDEQTLLRDICDLICDQAGYLMAWVGYAEHDEAKTVRPVAWAGFDSGYIASANLSWAEDTERGQGAAGMAIRGGETIYIRDIATNPHMARWRENALKRGYRSGLAMPLKDENGKAFGVLLIYSGKVNAISADEMRLLEQLAGDLAFGITALRNRVERKRMEMALRESEQKFRSLAENSSDNIFRYDKQGRIIYANHQVKTTLSGTDESFLGKTPLESSPNGLYEGGRAEIERYQATLRKVIATGDMADVEMRVLDASGTLRHHSVRFTAERDQEGRIVGALAFGRDITDKSRLEEQLRQSQKMEAIGQLAGGVAHDFNNILTAIIGFGNLAKMRMDPGDPQRPLIEQILVSSDRAAHLTQGLLAFSRKQVIIPKPVDLNAIVKSITKLLRRLIGEDIEFTTRLSANSLIVMADAGQIEQVLMNLATNARDAMPGGGELSVSTEMRVLGADFTEAHGYGQPGRYAMITVSDTGLGMDEATREKIFEPFFTTKEQGKGTGLGLSMVYGIIKQHEGNINVYSEPGKGTTFRILLPLIALEVEASQAETSGPPPGGTETLLLAEDDEEVRILTTTVLQEFGYRVIEAVDGKNALEKYRSNTKDIDLLILDVIMPRMSGKEVLDAVKAISPEAKILFMSGYTADALQKKGLFNEGVQFIAKPMSPYELLKNVRGILDGNG